MAKRIVLLIALLVVLLIVYKLLSQIMDALKSGDRLSQQAQKVFNLENKNKDLEKRLTEVQSEEFIEQQARNKLGLGKAEETIIIIPDEKLKEVLGASKSAQAVRLPNWLGWWRVFWK